jgi:hypothetical protein
VAQPDDVADSSGEVRTVISEFTSTSMMARWQRELIESLKDEE